MKRIHNDKKEKVYASNVGMDHQQNPSVQFIRLLGKMRKYHLESCPRSIHII